MERVPTSQDKTDSSINLGKKKQSILELVLWILEKNVTPLSYDVSFSRHFAVLMCLLTSQLLSKGYS